MGFLIFRLAFYTVRNGDFAKIGLKLDHLENRGIGKPAL